MGVKKKKDSKRNGISREQEQRSSSEGGTTSLRADCPEDGVVKVRMGRKWGTGTDGERNQGHLGMCKVHRETVRSAGSNTEMGTENPSLGIRESEIGSWPASNQL